VTEPTVRRRAVVTGRVQGVWFRAFVADAARRYGVAGFARNEPDGSVLVELEGGQEAVSSVIEQCRIGPPLAEVTTVAVEVIDPNGSTGFADR
jgi:acylphosphatase